MEFKDISKMIDSYILLEGFKNIHIWKIKLINKNDLYLVTELGTEWKIRQFASKKYSNNYHEISYEGTLYSKFKKVNNKIIMRDQDEIEKFIEF